MIYPEIATDQRSTKSIRLTGGVKEDAAQLDMKAGELIDSENYHEIEGTRTGYTSVQGYEVTDGTGLASEVDITYYTDHGLDKYTSILLEADAAEYDLYSCNPVDKSFNSFPTTSDNVILTENAPPLPRFLGAHFYFNGAADITVTPVNPLKINVRDKNFCWDFIAVPQSDGSIINSAGIAIDIVGGLLTFTLNTDLTTHVLNCTTVLPTDEYTHVALCREDERILIFLNGEISISHTLTAGEVIDDGTEVIFGSGYTGILDEIRLCKHKTPWGVDFDIPTLPYSTGGYFESTIDDSLREERRAEIEPVPGVGAITGLHLMGTALYAARPTASGRAVVHLKDSGWQPLTPDLDENVVMNMTTCRFDLLPGRQREDTTFYADGVNDHGYIDDLLLMPITHASLPAEKPFKVLEFKNRLFLFYSDGRVWYSKAGDPLNYDTAVGGAGEIYLEDELNDAIVGVGDTLVVYGERRTFVIKSLADLNGVSGETMALYKFKVDQYSDVSGSYPNTAKRILGSILYLDDRGITTMSAVRKFGSYGAAMLSRNVQRSLLKKLDEGLVPVAAINRKYNQYNLYFSDGSGYICTLTTDNRLRSIMPLKYPHAIHRCTQHHGLSYATSGSRSLGYVFRMDSGTSFNGVAIEGWLKTSFHAYRTPGNWKGFHRLTLEAMIDRDVTIGCRTHFNFKANRLLQSLPRDAITAKGSDGKYGRDAWGAFRYGSAITQSPIIYPKGEGYNMSIELKTSDKWHEPHTFNNVLVEYTQHARRQ